MMTTGQRDAKPAATPAATHIVEPPVASTPTRFGLSVTAASSGHAHRAGRQRARLTPTMDRGTIHQRIGGSAPTTAKTGPAGGGYRPGIDATSLVPEPWSNRYGANCHDEYIEASSEPRRPSSAKRR